METLAVVAYRQPALRADIEAVRGVQSGEVLRQLIERDLVRIVGRSNELGRPFLYGTTKKFLQVFGLRCLDELPRADSLRAGQTSTTSSPDGTSNSSDDTAKSFNQFTVAEEETNVKTLISKQPRQQTRAEDQGVTTTRPSHDDRPGNQGVFDQYDEEEEDDEEEDDFDDEEDYDDDDFEDEEEEEDEDLDEEPWEEVEDDEDLDEEEDEDEDDWDEDEDWEDEDEDWDEDEDDWEEDEEEEEEEKE
jgi:segregation and condensation protein B